VRPVDEYVEVERLQVRASQRRARLDRERNRRVVAGRIESGTAGGLAESDRLAVDKRLERHVDVGEADLGTGQRNLSGNRSGRAQRERHAIARGEVDERTLIDVTPGADDRVEDQTAAVPTVGTGRDAEMRIVVTRAAAVA